MQDWGKEEVAVINQVDKAVDKWESGFRPDESKEEEQEEFLQAYSSIYQHEIQEEKKEIDSFKEELLVGDVEIVIFIGQRKPEEEVEQCEKEERKVESIWQST